MPRPTAKKPDRVWVHYSPESPRVQINIQVLYYICLLQLPFKAAMWSNVSPVPRLRGVHQTHLGAANDLGSLHLPRLPRLPTSLVAIADTRLALSCLPGTSSLVQPFYTQTAGKGAMVHESTLNSRLSQPEKKNTETNPFKTSNLANFLQLQTQLGHLVRPLQTRQPPQITSASGAGMQTVQNVLPTVLQNEEPMHHAWN